jgi:predicted transcriptional regulator
MATVKATFTLDSETASKLAQAASRTNRSKSAVVREAIHDYSKKADKLRPDEQKRMLKALDELLPRTATRTPEEVDAELAEIRAARRSGGRGGARATSS